MVVRQFPSQRRSAPRRVSRTLAIVLLGLQAFLWGGGSIAEARSAAESLSRYSHVEDTGNPTCPPIHSHLDCLICRTLSGGANAGASGALFACSAAEANRRLPDIQVLAERALPGTLGSRGPPAA